MKKLLAAIALSTFSVVAMAEGAQPKHIISIGTEGFGWSGLSQKYEWDEADSGIKDHTTSEANLNINYNYVFSNRFMLGAELEIKTESSEIKKTNGDKIKSESSGTEFGISFGYNFNEDVNNSWWAKLVIASGKYNEETKDSSGKDKFDFSYSSSYIRGGKRISLDSWGLKNISYNPSISLASAKVSGDAKDAGLDKMTQVTIDFIRLDILF